ncbi:MAG: transposase [Turicibacter sp.]|nr:transposase [Turicibacter sp.]
MNLNHINDFIQLKNITVKNYHKCRYTNGAIEERNNKIKTLIRRSYFIPNRMSYESRIFLECN